MSPVVYLVLIPVFTVVLLKLADRVRPSKWWETNKRITFADFERQWRYPEAELDNLLASY